MQLKQVIKKWLRLMQALVNFLDFIYFSLVFYDLYRQYWSICSILVLKMLRLMKLKLSVTNNFKIYTIPPGQLRHHPPLANNKTLFDIDLLWLLVISYDF